MTKNITSFSQVANDWLSKQSSSANVNQFLKDYAQVSLEALEKIPDPEDFLIQKTEKYLQQYHSVLRKELTQANKYVAQHLAQVIATAGIQSSLSSEKIVSLFNTLLLDYFTFESTKEKNQVWLGKEDFLDSVIEIFLNGAIAKQSRPLQFNQGLSLDANVRTVTTATQIYLNRVHKVEDLPVNLVHSILHRASQRDRQEYALVYVLFAAGLSTEELVNLERSHLFRENGQHIVQINRGTIRQIPLNQWILGKRYGFPHSDPLTQWLQTHKDPHLALFINAQKQPLSEGELRTLWQTLTAGLLTPQSQSPRLEQTKQTWCVEMLMKGISLENLSILSGIEVEQLQFFAKRVEAKLAIKNAGSIDR